MASSRRFSHKSEDYAWAFEIAIQPDGKMVAAGTLHYAYGPNDLRAEIAVARYMPDGTLDHVRRGWPPNCRRW